MVNENAYKILAKRYLAKDLEGNLIEDVEGMLRRVAKTIAKSETRYKGGNPDRAEQVYFDMMANMEFLPNSPTLMNAGRPLGQLSACFVLPIDDDTESIFDAIKYAALIHKSGGGTGFSFTRLRPSGSIVKSTNGVASGPISFLKVFNAATECIKQGGVRRGANMGILRVDHPNIIDFINCKAVNTEITNFNLSVGITDVFMQAVEQNTKYDLIDPRSKEKVGELDAKEVFDMIIEGAWKNGEPGVVFLDRINAANPTPWLGDMEATNPCGEQPLLPYEACNLGSINLAKMVSRTAVAVDYEKLEKTVRMSVRFLDGVVDENNYPLPEIDRMTRSTRKIGLGVMGWADMLIILGIPYNSEEAIFLARDVMNFINGIALDESKKLAERRGIYPAGEGHDVNVRNATRTTIAPTGTISIVADCSSGVEPLFAIAFMRNQADMMLKDVNPMFRRMMEDRGVEVTEEMIDRIMEAGTIAHMDDIPAEIRRVFVTAHDISPEYHIKMQAAFQAHTDNAVSKTINLPHSATKADVEDVYMLAYKTGCKGTTMYRDGSRESQVLTTGATAAKEEPKTVEQPATLQVKPRQRPDITTGFTEKVQIGCGKLYVTVNYDEEGLCEVFTNTGRSGGCPSQSEAVSRLVSLGLRSNIQPAAIIDQLKGIRCPSTTGKGLKCTSCPDAIGRLLEKVLKQQQQKEIIYDKVEVTTFGDSEPKFIDGEGHCPECSEVVEHEGGCMVCRNCGYSKCG